MGTGYEKFDVGQMSTGLSEEVTADFTAAAWNTVGDHGIFQLSGTIMYRIFPIVTATLTSGGAATLALGAQVVDGAATTDHFVAATVYSTLIGGSGTAAVLWSGTTPASYGSADGSVLPQLRFSSGLVRIQYTVATAALTGGSIRFVVRWVPITEGSLVEPLDGADYIP